MLNLKNGQTLILILFFFLLFNPLNSRHVADPALPCSGNDMQWWRDARFGMFIHWGPYSQLAGEWNDRQMPVGEIAEWIMHYFKINFWNINYL